MFMYILSRMPLVVWPVSIAIAVAVAFLMFVLIGDAP